MEAVYNLASSSGPPAEDERAQSVPPQHPPAARDGGRMQVWDQLLNAVCRPYRCVPVAYLGYCQCKLRHVRRLHLESRPPGKGSFRMPPGKANKQHVLGDGDARKECAFDVSMLALMDP